MNIENVKDVAMQAAKEAGKFLMEHFGNPTVITDPVSHACCPTTKEDANAEKIINKIIKKAFPDHSILGEELGEDIKQSEYKWIVDPIDGTSNFVAGRTTFSVSIALQQGDEIILGVVFLPARDEMFLAEKGKGSSLNGKSIHVSDQIDIKKAQIMLSTYPGSEKLTEKLTKKVLETIKLVRYLDCPECIDVEFGRGSMAAEFCYLAKGELDALLRFKQKPWDVAAGQIVASEAGAVMCNLEGKATSIYEGDYVCANKELLERIKNIVL